MLNEAFLIGSVVAEPIITQSRDGRPVTMVLLRIQSHHHDSDGNKVFRENTIKVVFLNSLAEAAEVALEQGMEVYVKGRVQAEERTDYETGYRHRTLNVIGFHFHVTKGRKTRRQEAELSSWNTRDDDSPASWRNDNSKDY